ncbi:TatD family hydrolase [Arthrobacter sp. AOP36-A1-22]|uniref:TatD family hydrolase n=1 Tax=Arthrobacter sp. AOP36-A1-22 TaxID=3457684 RepID=UPI004034BF9D
MCPSPRPDVSPAETGSDDGVVLPGDTPPAYRASGEDPAARESAGGSRRDSKAANGSKRDVSYPPAPEPLAVPVVDNHTHLDFGDGEVTVAVAQALDTANAVGVSGIIQVGCDVESSRFAVEAAHADPRVLAAVAIHPNDASRLAERGELEAALAEIDRLAGDPRVRAVGETGLDYFRTGQEGRPAQQESFRAHLEMAVRHDQAVQIHDREAHADIVEILGQVPIPDTVVFHCFSGDAELARICNAHGWYMSFSGTVTFKNSRDLREALAIADPALVLVETDAPFLTPHPFRGRPNASYLIPYTVRSMAETLQADVDGLCDRIARNTAAAYGSF